MLAIPLVYLDEKAKVFLGQFLDNLNNIESLILHKIYKCLINPAEIHNPHAQNKTDKKGAGHGNGEGL